MYSTATKAATQAGDDLRIAKVGSGEYKSNKTMKVVFRDIMVKHSGISKFRLLGNSASSKALDWSNKGTEIFTMVFCGWDVPAIAESLGVEKNTFTHT